MWTVAIAYASIMITMLVSNEIARSVHTQNCLDRPRKLRFRLYSKQIAKANNSLVGKAFSLLLLDIS